MVRLAVVISAALLAVACGTPVPQPSSNLAPPAGTADPLPRPSSEPATASLTPDGGALTTWRIDASRPVEGTKILRLLVAQNACGFDAASVGPVLATDVQYSDDNVELKVNALPGFDPASCRFEQPVEVPIEVEIQEVLNGRALVDGGVNPPAVRWLTPPAGALPLAAFGIGDHPVGVPYGPGACAGVGLDATLVGSADDPRHVWLQGQLSGPRYGLLLWPPGFSVLFTSDGFQIFNEAGEVVHRGGEHVDGACVNEGGLDLYGSGWSVLN
jgi:hypothetical protein